jgi:hypothetical protein
MNKFAIIFCISFFFYIACKSTITNVVPVLLYGNMTGTVQLYDSLYFERMQNNVGVKVSLEGTNFSSITDSNGMWIINNVPSGTYTIVYQKKNFASMKNIGHQFIGNGTDYLGSQDLYKLLCIDVSIEDWFQILTTPPDTGHFGEEERKALMAFGKTPNISLSDPTSYLALNYYDKEYITDTSKGLFFSYQYYARYDFQRGDTVYYKAFVGGYNCMNTYYINPKTGMKIYTAFNNYSSVGYYIAQ